MRIEPYLAWRWHPKRCHCWHLARAAWLELTGIDLGAREPESMAADALRAHFEREALDFERIDRPLSPCLVLMLNPGAVPHVGVFIRGRILQMERTGPSYALAGPSLSRWAEVRFYRCRR